MAIRQTTHIIKNSDITNKPLPGNLVKGEPIVNTADGIMYYSGVTQTTNEWTPAGTGTTANFFEVGSNLYDLKLRNKITHYNNINDLSGKFLSGGTNGFVLADISSIQGVDSYVTGGTNNTSTNYTNSASIGLKYNQYVPDGTNSLPYTDTFTTGATLNGSTVNFKKNDGTTYSVDLVSLSPTGFTDTYVTGFTYNNVNKLTISKNQGEPDLNVTINSLTVTGLTNTSLTPGQVVYVGGSNELKTESGFQYDDSTDRLSVYSLTVNNPSGTTSYFGQGGLVIGSGGSVYIPGIGDLTVHGNLTVFGDTTTISTSELYVEDPQITLNYNPTGNTSVTSISSGLRIQDGDGNSNDVLFTVAQMNTFTGGDVTEYSGPTGYTNRSFLTQLNDIIIRNTNSNNGAPDGVRVLAEGDFLDGGNF